MKMSKKEIKIRIKIYGPAGIRTRDPQIRSLMPYPG